MPFKSKKQMRKCFALKVQGKAKGWNCEEWADKTDMEKLPEKTASANTYFGIEKLASMEKLAKKAIAKAFLKGTVSASTLRGYAKSIGKSIHIKHLGRGLNQSANLVSHPKFGKSVMKTPVRATGAPSSINKELVRNRNIEFEALSHLKKLSKGRKNIQVAQVKGKEGVKHFQQYVKPTKLDKAHISGLKKGKWDSVSDDFNYDLGEGALNRSTQGLFKRFSKKYPNYGDISRRNLVNNKVVDFMSGGAV